MQQPGRPGESWPLERNIQHMTAKPVPAPSIVILMTRSTNLGLRLFSLVKSVSIAFSALQGPSSSNFSCAASSIGRVPCKTWRILQAIEDVEGYEGEHSDLATFFANDTYSLFSPDAGDEIIDFAGVNKSLYRAHDLASCLSALAAWLAVVSFVIRALAGFVCARCCPMRLPWAST